MPTYREIFPGFQVFDCDRLHASLSPRACADNWKNRKCLSCEGCDIGRSHAGASPRKVDPVFRVAKKCCRCGRSSMRLVGGFLCVSCYNRQREAAIWSNARKGAPVKAGHRLHWISAIIQAPHQTMQNSRYADKRNAPILRLGMPEPIRYGGASTFWIEAAMTGADEFSAYLARVMPDSKILDIDIGPTFADMHPTPTKQGHQHADHLSGRRRHHG